MNKIDRALAEFNEMDDLAMGESPVHALHPLAKLLVTIAYVFVTVSFGRYDLSRLVVMVLYPVLMFSLAGLRIRDCLYKLRLVLPLILAVGIANPFFDRAVLLRLGPVPVSGGVISMVTLMMKGIFAILASYLLAATTPMDRLCAALRKLRVPSVLVTLLLLTYRYISVMIEQVSIMTQAYQLRAPGQKGIAFASWGSFLGQLLLRSMDQAQEMYESMQLRGFDGEFFYAESGSFGIGSVVYVLIGLTFFAAARALDLTALLGGLFV